MANGTYSLSIIGVNAVGNPNVYNSAYDEYLVGPLTPTFGSTQVFPTASFGQPVTVTSSESVAGPVVTDTVTITVPTYFDPTGHTYAGQPIETLLFDLGPNIPSEPAFQTAGLNLALPINPITLSTTATTTSSAFGVTPLGTDVALNGTNTQIFGDAGVNVVNSGGSPLDLGSFGFSSFTYTASYSVPEPASLGLLAAAFGGTGLLRRRRA
jgi:hypothetical protein